MPERDYSPANQKLLEGSVAMALAMHSDVLGRVELEVAEDGITYTGRVIIHRPSGPWAVSVAPAQEIPDA